MLMCVAYNTSTNVFLLLGRKGAKSKLPFYVFPEHNHLTMNGHPSGEHEVDIRNAFSKWVNGWCIFNK